MDEECTFYPKTNNKSGDNVPKKGNQKSEELYQYAKMRKNIAENRHKNKQ